MWRGVCVWAALVALATPAVAQSLDAARAALASGRSDEAAGIAEPLAAAGQVEALALLGLIARDAIPPDTDRARALLETAAASGASTALNALGRAYQTGGLGLPRDLPRALDHYERAVAAGSRVAEVNLIALVASGVLGDPDWPALRDRLQALAEDRVPGAAATLAEMLATGRGGLAAPGRARALVEGVDDPRALRLLGWMRLQGVGGPVDVALGRQTLERAVRAGSGSAATDLGLMARDEAVPDLIGARQWFERAAAAGDGWGATHLARLLSDGEGTVPDEAGRAFDLFRAGDARGVVAATHGLAIAYWDGLGTQADPARARDVMTRAASRGFPRALNDLGVMWETGIGGAADPQRAADHYAAAARAGDVLGARNLATLLLSPETAPSDPVDGYAWCLWAEDRAQEAAMRAEIRAQCAAATEPLTADERARGAARFAELRGIGRPGAAP